MIVKHETISGPLQGTTFTVITLNRESNCTCREKNHSQFPQRKIDVTRATCTTLDVMLERRMDGYWSIEGIRDLSDSWTRVTRFTLLEEKHPDGYTWSGERLTEKQTTYRPDYLWPEIWKKMPEASQRKEERKWAIEKPMLEGCEGYTSLIQQMWSSKKLSTIRGESWKFQCQPQCLARSGEERTR